MKPAAWIATIFLALVALAHLLRFVLQIQVTAGTTATAWARWTPRIPASGSYTVYMRWTSATNRTTSARVVICTPSGTVAKTVNQRVNGGVWNSLGRYYFAAGYAPGTNSVILYATGATGYVVCDAVMFVP